MTRTSPPQVAFTAGELDPLLHGRFDYQRYQTGLASCFGFLPLPQGGITRAPGTTHIGAPAPGAACILLPFQFSAFDAVVLELTPNLMRVWRYGVLVQKPDNSGPFELATPFNAADLPRLRWVQSADVIYLVDGRHPVQRLSRFALNQWSIANQAFDSGPFCVQNLDKAKNIQCSATTGSITLTANFDIFSAGHLGSLIQITPTDNTTIPLWTSNEAVTVATSGGPGIPASLASRRRYGRNVYELTAGSNSGTNPPVHEEGEDLVDNAPTKWLFLNDNIGVVRITAIVGPREATATVIRALSPAVVASATYRWSEGAWSELYGFPSSIEIFEQRLCLAATPSEPRTVWFSTVGAYADFLPSTEPDGAFGYTIAGSDTQNRITGLTQGRVGLHIFTEGEEYSSRPESRSSAIGPTNAVFTRDGTNGARDGRAVSPDGDPMFISRDGSRLILSRYDIQSDANRALNMGRASQHLGQGGFRKVVWTQTPEPRAWVLRNGGDLAVVIYDRDEEILGWSRHSVAGNITDIAVTQNADSTFDEVWLVVDRTAAGMGVSIERLDFAHHFFNARLFSGPGTVTSLSAPWLASQTAGLVTSGDGAQDTVIAVAADGTVDLWGGTAFAVLGLIDPGHEALTLDITAAAPDGSSMGRYKRLDGPLGVALHKTTGGTVEVVETHDPGHTPPAAAAQPLLRRGVGQSFADPFTGVIDLRAPSGNARRVQLRFRPQGGASLTILGIVPTVTEVGR